MSKKQSDEFVHLHMHSDMSQLDGCGKIPEYVKVAKARGNKAVAFTDHGTMRGYLQLHEESKQLDIKPIYGIEFYVSPDMRRKGLTDDERQEVTKGVPKSDQRAALKDYEERTGLRDRWHTTVWAHSQEGLQNLFRLSSAAFIDGFYYKPRIDMDELIKYGDGLIVGTGCLSSPINDSWMQGKKKSAMDYADTLSDAFGDRMYLEVMPHAIRDQVICNKMLVGLRERYGNKHKLLATQDAHYVNREDAPHHEVLLCIGTGKNLSDPDRFKFDGDEFYMKTRDEMADTFRKNMGFMKSQHIKEALDSTLEIADRCNAAVEVDYHATHLPEPGVPSKYNGDKDPNYSYFRDLVKDGWAWREIPRRAKVYAAKHGVTKQHAVRLYIDRVKREMKAIQGQGFVKYFLIVHDIYHHARTNSIMVGPGRGSVGGSLVAYLLGLTSVDPIEHGLIFERFINPNRIDEPDIDMDFEDRRRREIMDYIVEKYGQDNVCQIATVGKLSGKQCLRDVSRVLEVPKREVDKVTKSIVERSSGDERASQTIADSFQEFEVCKTFNARYPQVLHHSKRLEGMAKNLGIHAAGIVASPVPLTDLIPLEIRKHDGKDLVVSAVDMYGVASAGLVKLDVLGLRTLTVIKEALEMVEKRTGRKIDMEDPNDVDLNDPKVLEGFTRHNYGGVFQYDTPSADKVCSGVEFTSFEDVAAMTALNRPGTSRSGLATKYVARKKNPKLVAKVDFHETVSKITSDTLGIIVYQEHVIKIFTECAGFAPGTADSLRKTIAKKIGDETMDKNRDNFVAGCAKHSGIDAKTANKIMDAITFFGCLAEGTEVLVNGGLDVIENVEPGDEIYSVREDNVLVRNEIKSCGLSGTKEVFTITTNHTEVEASADHYWLVRLQDGSHDYKKTKDLSPGDLIGYATGFNHITVPKPRLQDDDEEIELHLRKESVLQRDVQRVLPKGVPGEENESGEPGRLEYREESGRREALEEGVDQRNVAFCGRAGTFHRGREEPGVGGRPFHGVQEGEGRDSGDAEGLQSLREAPGSERESVEHEDFAHPPQGSGSKEQQFGESRSVVSELPQQGALGGKSSWSPVIDVSPSRRVRTYDLECEGEPANYILGNGLVCHNSYGFNKSHATEYAMIAFWCMWLKTYYPLEFYWSLMANEPDHIRVQQIAKDSKRQKIELLPPHVNVSDWRFSIDNDKGAIRASLVDIKGCGKAASKAIIETQPYKNLLDFVDRVNRRHVHKGVVTVLASAGALQGIIPNRKHFVENIEEWWKELTRKKRNPAALVKLFRAAKKARDYTKEERGLLAAKVSPTAFGSHPIDAYKSFMKRELKVPLVLMGHDDPEEEETFFKDYDNVGVFIAGIIVEVKYNQVGDFHTGAAPTEAEKRRQFWGSRYANVNIEDKTGKQNRFKVDFDIFDRFRDVVDAGVGTPVIVHAHPMDFTGTCRAHFIVNVEKWRNDTRSGAELSVWQEVLGGQHPVNKYPWKTKEIHKERRHNSSFGKYGGHWTGLVTQIRLKYDKKGGLMAYVGMLDGKGEWIEVMFFASIWKDVKRKLKTGQLIRIELQKKPDRYRGWAYIYDGGRLRIFNQE